VQSVESQPTLRRVMSPPSSGSKNKPSKNSAVSGTCCLLHAAFFMAYSPALKMEVTYFSETSVDFHRITLCYIPEDRAL
jgi:hypothetical protein